MEGQKRCISAFLSALRANARASRARSKKQQRHSVGTDNGYVHTSFQTNRFNFATHFSSNRWTEAIPLREAGSTKSLSVGPSGPKNMSKLKKELKTKVENLKSRHF